MQSQLRVFRTIGPFFQAAGLRAVTWDPLETDGSLTLSNGNLTATNHQTSDTGVYGSTQVTTAKSSGKYYWELTCTGSSPQVSYSVGICNAPFNSNANLGTNINSAAYYGNSNLGLWINNIATGTPGASVLFGPGQIVGLAADFGAQLIWMSNVTTNAGQWNIGGAPDPAAGIGGYSFSSVAGPYFAAVSLRDDGSGTDGFTVNFGYTAPFVGIQPNGFGNW